MNPPTRPNEQGTAHEVGAPVTRRSFLGVLLGFGTVVIGAALSVPVIRFALHPLLATTTKTAWSDIGKVDEFASLTAPLKKLITVEQRDGWRKIVSEKAIYVLPPKNGGARVLSPICPHLGCSFVERREEGVYLSLSRRGLRGRWIEDFGTSTALNG